MSVVLRLGHEAGKVCLPLNRRAHVRDRIAAEIERLVDMLDVLDGDPDEEPELGWPGNPVTLSEFPGTSDDREDDAGDDREPDEDREPILGWTDAENQADERRFGEAWRHDEDEESRQPPVTLPAAGKAAP